MRALKGMWGWADGKKTLTGIFLLLLWLAAPKLGVPQDVRAPILWAALPMLGVGLVHRGLKSETPKRSRRG